VGRNSFSRRRTFSASWSGSGQRSGWFEPSAKGRGATCWCGRKPPGRQRLGPGARAWARLGAALLADIGVGVYRGAEGTARAGSLSSGALRRRGRRKRPTINASTSRYTGSCMSAAFSAEPRRCAAAGRLAVECGSPLP
jgi:hypothetical protein